jgi:hypothetical protein
MLKFISSTVGSTTKTITSVLTLIDVQLYVSIEESLDDAHIELGKLKSTPKQRSDLLAKVQTTA